MTVTLKDIAQKADRSVITVSRALAGHSDVAESTRFLNEQNIPFVAFGRSDLGSSFPYVDEDSYTGTQLITQHMADLGHRRIGFVGAPRGLMFCRLRLDGYRDTLRANRLPVDERLIIHSDLTQRGGFGAAQELPALTPRPAAIVACNDLMALGAMSAAQKAGLIIGRDLSVGGFDDIPLAEHAHPPLTTVRQPIPKIGQLITRMLVQLIQGQLAPETVEDVRRPREARERAAETHVVLTPQLIVRESSGPLVHSA